MQQSNYNLKTQAHHYNPNINNGKLWIYKIKSNTSIGLMVYFNKFILPPEGVMYIYNSSKSIVYGPFTSLNSPSDTTKLVQFSTPIFNDNEMFMEYFEPNTKLFPAHIEFNNIIHLFRQPGGGQFGEALPYLFRRVLCT